MKDIAILLECDRKIKIGFFVDVLAFEPLITHLKRYKTHVTELKEIIKLIYADLRIVEKYCDLKLYTDIEGYKLIILSRGKSSLTILCKEKKEAGWRNIILIKQFKGMPEQTANLIKDEIKNKGGYDYEFKD
jgi:hypothetical protein